jgi:8-oxo-dGTP diphosphatase
MTAKSSRPRVVLVIRSVVLNKKKEVLLIRRAKTDSWQPGKWELPGGKIDAGEEVGDSLEREVFEETQLLVHPRNRIVYYDDAKLTTGKYKGMVYIQLVGVSIAQNTDVKLSDEHIGFEWLRYDKAIKKELTDESKKALIVLKNNIED